MKISTNKMKAKLLWSHISFFCIKTAPKSYHSNMSVGIMCIVESQTHTPLSGFSVSPRPSLYPGPTSTWIWGYTKWDLLPSCSYCFFLNFITMPVVPPIHFLAVIYQVCFQSLVSVGNVLIITRWPQKHLNFKQRSRGRKDGKQIALNHFESEIWCHIAERVLGRLLGQLHPS